MIKDLKFQSSIPGIKAVLQNRNNKIHFWRSAYKQAFGRNYRNKILTQIISNSNTFFTGAGKDTYTRKSSSFLPHFRYYLQHSFRVSLHFFGSIFGFYKGEIHIAFSFTNNPLSAVKKKICMCFIQKKSGSKSEKIIIEFHYRFCTAVIIRKHEHFNIFDAKGVSLLT